MDRDDPKGRLVLVRPAALPGAELFAGYDCPQPFYYFHERYVFTACMRLTSGGRDCDREDNPIDRWVMVLEPGATYFNTYISRPATFKVLFIDPHPLAECIRALGLPGSLHFAITSDPRLFRGLHRLCASIEDGYDGLEQRSLFALCVAAFAWHAEQKPRAFKASDGKLAVERAKAYLRERFDEAVSLHDVATVARLSEFHLVHTFTKHVGVPPHAYHVHVRVERGRALLQKGMSPADAAASVGFADQSHFTRHFKRIMRMTPAEYARWDARSSAAFV